MDITQDSNYLLNSGGFFPKFYSSENPSICGSLREVVQKTGAQQIDYRAIGTLFRLGTFIDGQTPFVGIRRHTPDPIICAPLDISRDAAIDAYIDLFRQAIARRAHRPAVQTLSGGRDSRQQGISNLLFAPRPGP